MKNSIRTRFTLGMIFFFTIIAGISILSAYQLNSLSKKTDAILKDNNFSIIMARDMAEGLTILNQEIIRYSFNNIYPDATIIANTKAKFEKSIQLEKNNITEAGEDKLASEIEIGFKEYLKNINTLINGSIPAENLNFMLTQFHSLYQQTMLLSQMNEQAIVRKSDDAKNSARKGLTDVTILGTICFIITLSFTFNFASYFNERFTKLYNGIKEIGAKNYDQRLYFEGEDEFYDISLVFNEMAQNLNENTKSSKVNFQEEFEREISLNQIQELKRILEQMQGVEERAVDLIAKLENKENKNGLT
ncbi:MAG: HAMP domain-containing protein [Bacteroidota bacterium]